MSAVLRARTIGETRGFMKALIDLRSERILGFAVLGGGGGRGANGDAGGGFGISGCAMPSSPIPRWPRA
jgi:hypothetical protein